jgi:hypothetical protein
MKPCCRSLLWDEGNDRAEGLTRSSRYRRLIAGAIVALLSAVVVGLGAGVADPAAASAATCTGSACTNQDPYVTGCDIGDSVAGSAPIVDSSGATIGEIKLYWSPACESNWGQAYFNDGNPANTPPVTISVQGSSPGGRYDVGSTPFTSTGSGSPVWGNMVYSPGCAYTTATRGTASGTAVQAGCSQPGQPSSSPPSSQPGTTVPPGQPGPIVLSLPPPLTKCTGTLCTGQDPYEESCSMSANVVGSAPIVDEGGNVGTVQILSSPSCEASWGRAYFNDDNPASTPPVSVKVEGTEGAGSSGPYNTYPVEYTTWGSGSPVWGNMVASTGCSYAFVSRGSASGLAVQEGCPIPGTSAPAVTDSLTAWGVPSQVAGGVGVPGLEAEFTASDTSLRANNFTATIDWGDGSGPSTGQIVGLNGQFSVSGNHRYPDPGQSGQTAQSYDVTVTINGSDGSSAIAYTSVVVTSLEVSVTQPSDGSQPAMSSGDKTLGIGFGLLQTVAGFAECGGGLFGEDLTLGLDTVLTGYECGEATGDAAGLGSDINDPPASGYRKVVKVRPDELPHVPKRCGFMRKVTCNAVHAAVVRYLRAADRASAFLEALGATVNRFGGAVAHRDHRAEHLQRAAAHRYLTAWIAAVRARRQTGHKLGMLLQRNKLDRRLSGAQILAARKRFLALSGVGSKQLAGLKRRGLIASKAALVTEIERQLGWGPPPADTTLSALLES